MRGLGQELTAELGEKVLYHRDQFHSWFEGRYLEGLSALFSYNFGRYPIDIQSLEVALRQGYGVAIGTDINDNFTIFGYVNAPQNSGLSPATLLAPRAPLKGQDIFWTLPAALRPPDYKEISEITAQDSAVSGRFAVLWNKALALTNDFQILSSYADELAEIVASRFSLEIQAKVTTIFMSDIGDETINQMVAKIYNGEPFVKTGQNFDLRDNLYRVGNENIDNTLKSLKEEYQTKLSELNAIFGINTMAVEKSSGVSDAETQGNTQYSSVNANVWLVPRQHALDLLNVHYGTNFSVKMATSAASFIGGTPSE